MINPKGLLKKAQSDSDLEKMWRNRTIALRSLINTIDALLECDRAEIKEEEKLLRQKYKLAKKELEMAIVNAKRSNDLLVKFLKDNEESLSIVKS